MRHAFLLLVIAQMSLLSGCASWLPGGARPGTAVQVGAASAISASGVPPGSPQPGGPPPSSLQPFAAVVRDAQKIDGLFTLYRREERTWLELKPEDFGKPFFLSPKVTTGIGEAWLFGGLFEDARLDSLIRGRAVGLCQIEGDFARSQRIEHDGGEPGKPQPAFDEADRQPEPACNDFARRTSLDQRRKGLGLIGRIHREAVEVLGKTGFNGMFGAVFEDQAGHFMVLGQNLVLGETEHRLAAALTGLDLELALSRRPDDEVLQQAAGGNAGLEFGIGDRIGMPPDIARRRDKLAQRDRFDHGTYS